VLSPDFVWAEDFCVCSLPGFPSQPARPPTSATIQEIANLNLEQPSHDSSGGDVKLNHLNLTVSDVQATHDFLVKHFGLKEFGSLRPSAAMSFLSDDNGMILALFRAQEGVPVKYPAGFHIGFVQDSEQRVNEINERLREDGFKVAKPARLHGSWTFYFQSPGGFTIEVLC
jgi:lactoylglutathione lyase